MCTKFILCNDIVTIHTSVQRRHFEERHTVVEHLKVNTECPKAVSDKLEMFTANEIGLENLSRMKVEMWKGTNAESADIIILFFPRLLQSALLIAGVCSILRTGSQSTQMSNLETALLETSS
jgi:hypothetical protein